MRCSAHRGGPVTFHLPRNLKVGRVCPQHAGPRMPNGSGALGQTRPTSMGFSGAMRVFARGILSRAGSLRLGRSFA